MTKTDHRRKRRALVIAGVFPPGGGGGALRTAKLIKYLPPCGWDVAVIAPRGRSGWFADPELLDDLGEIPVTRVGLESAGLAFESVRRRLKSTDPQSSMQRAIGGAARIGKRLRDSLFIPDEHLLWSMLAARTAAAQLRSGRFDLLLTASFPYSCHLAGLLLQRRFDIPWVADFADPWTGHDLRIRRSAPLQAIDRYLETAVISGADATTVAAPGMSRMLSEWLPPALMDRVHQLSNSYDPEDYASVVAPSERDHFQLLFVGSFDANWTPPDPFLNALERLARADARSLKLRFEVLGGQDRVSSERIRNFLERVGGTDLLSVHGYTAHRTAIEAMRSADALAISVAPGGHWQITAKVSEYLATERPIVAAVPDGDCRDLLRHCGGAAVFEPTDVVGLSDWLRAAAATGEAVVERPREPARVAHLAAPQVASRAAALFDRVVAARGLP